MSSWRPQPRIRLKALGLHWRHGKLLAAEVYDDAGRLKGVRPLGGSVEFGETVEAALRREFNEELGIAVTPIGPPCYLENIYEHEGAAGHEILAIFDVTFPSGAFDGTDRITFHEDNGVTCYAEWFDLEQLDQPNGPALYPHGLMDLLRLRAR